MNLLFDFTGNPRSYEQLGSRSKFIKQVAISRTRNVVIGAYVKERSKNNENKLKIITILRFSL